MWAYCADFDWLTFGGFVALRMVRHLPNMRRRGLLTAHELGRSSLARGAVPALLG
jgi:hypothetical protein